MCGRYQFTSEQSAEILQIIQEVERKCGTEAARSVRQGEITPGCKMPVLVGSDGVTTPELYSWGFRTEDKLVFNAKAETAAKKNMFKDCVASRRCVVPSTGFYEWDKDHRKHYFTMPNATILYMAGLYAMRGGIPCFCILTTAPNDSVRPIHDRMPLVLEQEQVEPWLSDMKATGYFLNMTPPLLNVKSMEAQIGLW